MTSTQTDSSGKIDTRKRTVSKQALENAWTAQTRLTTAVHDFTRASEPAKRVLALGHMNDHLRSLRTAFSVGGFELLAHFSSLLAKLFATLSRDLDIVNSSNIKTVCTGMDFLTLAFASGAEFSQIAALPLQVLIVDDDPVCCRTLALALSNGDMRVTTCESGRDGIKVLQQHHFDVIFTDIMMPEMNGFAFAEHFKKLRNHAATPFVYVTALSDFKTRSNSVLSGGCDFIAKPFTPSEVAVKAFTVALKGRLTQLAATKAKNKLPDCSQGEALGVSMERFCGVICLDREGFIQTINQDCVEMLGYSSTEVVGKHLHSLFPPELQSGLKVSVLKHIETTGDGQGMEVVGRRKDSSHVKLAVCSSETKSNGKMLLVALIRYVLNEDSQD